MPQSRQLAVIMFTDIVGYTAMMGSDEQKAFELLNKNRQIQKPIIENFNGRFIKELGDGILASFSTVSDGVHAAICIQEACHAAKDFRLRIGIHLGEVTFENDDIFGDGVNIASRLQSIAAPGGIYISEAVHENVANKKDVQTVLLGKYSLKNVKDPITIFAISNPGLSVAAPQLPKEKDKTVSGIRSVGGKRLNIIKWTLPLLILCVAAIFLIPPWMKRQKAKNKLLPQIQKYLSDDNFSPIKAYQLAREAEKYIPGDTLLQSVWPRVARLVTTKTNPAGASVYWKEFGDTSENWNLIGTTPLKDVWIPGTLFNPVNTKIEKKGYETILYPITLNNSFDMDSAGTLPPGMIHMKGRPASTFIVGMSGNNRREIAGFMADRYEVTNKKFKQFADAGGYRDKKYWEGPFYKDDKEITWEQLMLTCVDKSGQRGPASWEAGSYADGKEEYPVTGVSWYEAMAYAKFAGKRLPSVYQWSMLANTLNPQVLVRLSNFSTIGPMPVGYMRGTSFGGLYDIAGNAREWCFNEANDTRQRFILGGGWNDLNYAFNDANTQDPSDRSLSNGLRCIMTLPGDTTLVAQSKPAQFSVRDYSAEKPVSDEVFSIFRKQFAYDNIPFNAKTTVLSDSGYARIEKIEIDAVYNKERSIFYLYLPRNAQPPYATVFFFPGSDGIHNRQFNIINDYYRNTFDFLLKQGMAVIYPVFKGAYERGDDLQSDLQNETVYYKAHVISWVQDTKRILDYMTLRKEIQNSNYGYYGTSWGSAMGPVLCAAEPRFTVAVFHVGGLMMEKTLPEVDVFNYLPRMTIPTLMMNGKNDAFFPIEKSQKPMFRNLGSPDNNKKFISYEGGHLVPRPELIKETLAWFNQYFKHQ